MLPGQKAASNPPMQSGKWIGRKKVAGFTETFARLGIASANSVPQYGSMNEALQRLDAPGPLNLYPWRSLPGQCLLSCTQLTADRFRDREFRTCASRPDSTVVCRFPTCWCANAGAFGRCRGDGGHLSRGAVERLPGSAG